MSQGESRRSAGLAMERERALVEVGWTARHEAARNGDAVGVTGGVDEPKTCDGWTPLMVAVWARHLECARRCLDEGATPKVASEDGFSVMHLAACRAQSDLVEILYRAGAPCSSLEAFVYVRQRLDAAFLKAGDNSFLRRDAEMDDDPDVYVAVSLDAVWPAPVERWLSRTEAGLLVGSKHLIVSPAPAEIARGAPPSHGGAGWPCAYAYRLACCLGAAPASGPRFGRSEESLAEATRLLAEASERGHLEVVRALLGGHQLPVGPALRRACGRDHEVLVVLLSPLASVSERESALPLACRYARLSVVKHLLGEGPPPDAAVLAAAGRFGRGAASVLRLLLKRGGQLECRDEDGRTPLMLAKSAEVARVLLQAGAVVSRRDRFGDSAETIASKAGRSGVVKAIREFGQRQ